MDTMISGVRKVTQKIFRDNRGSFIKTCNSDLHDEFGLRGVQEYFFSKSKKHVWRGMHLQVGEFASNRLIFCVNGAVIDFLLDLRKDSPTFLNVVSFELKADEAAEGVAVPAGVAHGFLSLCDGSEMHYISDKVYNELYDTGVSPTSVPLLLNRLEGFSINISDRDKQLPSLQDFLDDI